MLQVNLEGLKIVHQHYITPTQKYMSLKDTLNLCMKDSGLQLTSKQAKYCVGFCRMTVRAETIDNDAFVKVSFVELLEMIGRIASVKYQNTENEHLSLADKCILVLDLILPYFG